MNINNIKFILKNFVRKNLLLIIKNFISKQNKAYRIKKNELLNENNISELNNERNTIKNQNIKKNLKKLLLRFSFCLVIE